MAGLGYFRTNRTQTTLNKELYKSKTTVEMLLKENQLIDMCKNKIPKGNKGKKKFLQV